MVLISESTLAFTTWIISFIRKGVDSHQQKYGLDQKGHPFKVHLVLSM